MVDPPDAVIGVSAIAQQTKAAGRNFSVIDVPLCVGLAIGVPRIATCARSRYLQKLLRNFVKSR